MLSPVTLDIAGFNVRFRPLPATAAFSLAKRVGAALLPIVKTLDLSDMSAQVDFDKIIDAASRVLSELSDDKAVSLVVDSLMGATITPPRGVPVEISGRSDVDSVFCGELDALYQVVFESWKYNKLAPFKLAARFGFHPKTTGTSEGAASTPKKPGPALAG